MSSETIRREFLSREESNAAVEVVAKAAAAEGREVAIIGGLAMQLYGSPRLTRDADFAASAPIQSLPSIKPLSFGGYKTMIGTVPVDIVLRSDRVAALYREALATSLHVPGIPVRVPLPEFMVAMKMYAGRWEKDWPDIAFLVRQGKLDMALVERIVSAHLGWYAVKELEAFVAETLWRASREDTDE